MNKESLPVGVFDSGAGGISVLRCLRRMLPEESFLYYGDQAHAPYGTKTKEEVLSLAENAMELLLARGIKAAVIACNTATAAAAKELRSRYDFPIIGMEPAVKPASLLKKDGLVLCMATPGTLESEKFRSLTDRFGQVTPLPCPGLMELVEEGKAGGPETDGYLDALFAPYAGQKTDAVVLGCTHYVFLKEQVRRHFPAGTPVLDGNEGTARQLKRRLEEENLLASKGSTGTVELLTSGGEDSLLLMKRLLESPD